MGLKDNAAHKTSCVRHAVKIAKNIKDKSKDKTLLWTSADGGRDRNPKFERAQA